MVNPLKTIGILALQGGYDAHAKVVEQLGASAKLVRNPEELNHLDGLILPGGESTTMLKLLNRYDFFPALERWFQRGLPTFGTCAGLILLAKHVQNPEQRSLGWLDATVTRNGWGRQLDSFEAMDDAKQFPLCFIRAPRINEIGQTVEIVASLDGEPICIKQKHVYGATFHPELTESTALHQKIFSL